MNDISGELANFITRKYPNGAKTGANSCGAAVGTMLNAFGLASILPQS